MADRSTHDRTREQSGDGRGRGRRVAFTGRRTALLLVVGGLVVLIAIFRRAVTRPVLPTDQRPPVPPGTQPPDPPTPPDPPDPPDPPPVEKRIGPTVGEILTTEFGAEHVTAGTGPDFIVQVGDKRIAVNVYPILRSDSEPRTVANQAYVHAQGYFAPRLDRRPVMNGVVMVVGNRQLFDLLPPNPRERMRIVSWLSSTDDDAIVAAIRDLAA